MPDIDSSYQDNPHAQGMIAVEQKSSCMVAMLTRLGAAPPMAAESTVMAARANIAPENTCMVNVRSQADDLQMVGRFKQRENTYK